MRSLVRYGLYPGLMTGALVLLWALLHAGVPITLAPYLVVLCAGPVVVLAERLVPYRQQWTAGAGDYAQDALFMGLVQLVVPLGLVWLATLGIRELLVANGLTLNAWPVTWPILAQLALKVISGDFLRYWLHRLAHTWTPLWRLHQVHHHPSKLYSTNVFRFHPLEKSLQFLGDTLPFLILGVTPELLGWYFVFYAISGLFQHCNADLRLGWLNYLVSGPEVHRWHHSRVIAESNNNYAHSFVVWDLLFGTYFRPADREVIELGLIERNYPKGFIAQMSQPFRPLPKGL